MVAFSVGKGMSQKERNEFSRQFYGYVDKSNYGRYSYKRKGWLDQVPHLKPVKSVIILRNEDAQKVVDYLELFDAKLFIREIVLTQNDLIKLEIREGDGNQ